MSSKLRVIAVFDCNNNFLSYCTRKRAKEIVKQKKGYFVSDKTLKLRTKKSEEAKYKRQIIKEAKRRCYICTNTISKNDVATIDHVIPKSRDEYARNKYNMKCCCERCNYDKDDRTLSEYVAYIEEHRDKYNYLSDKRITYLKEFAHQFEKDYYNYYTKNIRKVEE